jgi:hypothetical protein
VKNVFIRGSVVRYVHLPASSVDVTLLEDATRRGELRAYPAGVGLIRGGTDGLIRSGSSTGQGEVMSDAGEKGRDVPRSSGGSPIPS